jgi:phenylacetate-CoA ligase
MNKDFNPAIERSMPSEIEAFQNKRLVLLLNYLATKSPFYQRLFKNEGVEWEDIQTIQDLTKIPVTTKNDLHQFNDDFLCVPRSEIVDFVTTSGTLGDPVTIALTDGDLDRLAYNEALSFAVAGCGKGDVFQLMTTLDRRFMAGMAYFLGARKLGAGVVRVGSGMPELQWDSIMRLKPSVIVAVPSFLIKLIEFARDKGIDYKNSSVKKAICIGEPLRKQDFTLNTLGQMISDAWPIALHTTYASTEMSTAFTECAHQVGGHHHPELIILELLDEHNKPVADGEEGEVTVTTLGVEGMPLLRFKTGDLCRAHAAQCKCGRTTLRLSPVLGRKQQMIKFKGTTLYPPALYDVLNNIKEVEDYVVEVYTNNMGTDEIRIRLAAKESNDDFIKIIKDRFRARLRVAPEVVFESADVIQQLKFPETSRKPVIFFDFR